MISTARASLAGPAVILCAGALGWLADGLPLPRAADPEGVARELRVADGAELQAAIDEAQPGDVILLEPGVVYRGPFVLPDRPGEEWIELRSASPRLPPAGTRIGPDMAAELPELVSDGPPVISTADNAHHWRLVGLNVHPVPGGFLDDVVRLAPADRPDAFPHDIVIERSWIHGDPERGSKRGIALNSADTEVLDSYLSDFKGKGLETQAIAGWSGPGAYRIVNNWLEAAGINVLFGGGDPAVAGLVPADIELRRNDLIKPLEWKDAAQGWLVKNLFELKNARRVVVDGNVFANTWPGGQAGFAILFTVRNQDGGAPWSVVEDVRFTNNVVRNAAGGINFLGRDDGAASGQTRGVLVRNNVFEQIGGRLFQLLDNTADVVIEHNIALAGGPIVFAEGRPHTGFVLRDNVIVGTTAVLAGTGTTPGLPTLERYFPSSIVRGNLVVGSDARSYPPGNTFPGDVRELRLGRELPYALGAESPFVSRAAGGPPGVLVREFHEARRQ